MAIVWACALTVDEYLAAGRQVEVPRVDCGDCGGPMTFRSGYHRDLRAEGGSCHRAWIARAECSACAKTHALLPSFLVAWRLDVAATIGKVIGAAVDAGLGVRRAVEGTTVPHTTARDWVRRFAARAPALAAGLASAAVALGDDSFVPPRLAAARSALEALRGAWRALMARVGWRAPGLWAFATLVTGGTLVATARHPLSIFLGSRRLIPPAP